MTLLGEPWWYWLLAAGAAVLLLAPPVMAWWEDRQDAQDRERWSRMPGAR